MEQINDTIRQQVAGMPDRLPMLCYALDTDLLSDDCYQALLELQNAGQLSPDMPWLLGLYWARRFYERGRGNNYLDVIGQGAFDASKLAQSVFQKWGIAGRDFPGVGNNLNLYRFLSECWLITGDQGETSRLWKALTAIVEEVPDNCEDEDVLEAVGRLRDEGLRVPAFLTWRAENGPWLAESIRAIKTGNGEGWLGVIGSNPFWNDYRQRDSATVAWGLRKDGNRVQWSVQIANVRLQANSSIKVIQSNRNLYECKGERHVLFSELGPEFESIQPLVIRAGARRLDLDPLPPLGQPRPLVFRKSRSSSFHRLVHVDNKSDEGEEHIQATSLYLLPPNEIASVRFGNDQVQAVYAGKVTPDVYGHSLYELDLRTFNRAEPKWLSWNEENFLQIGGKPYIIATNVAENFNLRNQQDVLVVFGNSSVLHAANLPQGHEDPKWSIEGGQHQDTAYGSVNVTPDAMGTIVKAACKIGNTRCQIRLMFLPEELQAPATGLAAAEGDGWAWIPEVCEDYKCAAAENGRVRGRARIDPQADNEGLEIEASATQPLWWWRGIGQLRTNFCSALENITTLTDLQNKWLRVHIPVGMNASLLLNDQHLNETTLFEGLNEIRVFDLLRGVVDFNEQGNVSTLSLRCGDQRHVLTSFLSYPSDPMLFRTANGFAVYFPQADQAGQYHVCVVRQSALLTGNIQRIALDPANVIDNLHPVAIENPALNEGCWILLLPNAGIEQRTLLELAWKLRNHTAGRGMALQVHPPCPNTPIPTLLQQWNGGQPLSVQQLSSIQQIAGFIRGGNSIVLKEIFERFLRHEDFSSMAGNATTATSFLEKHMEERFAIADLLEPLSRLLHLGFNWLAEPNWISGKEGQIKFWYTNPSGNKRRNWNHQNGVTALIESIPIIPAIRDIEAGYPYGFEQARVPELREIATLDFNQQNPPLQGVIQISSGQLNHRLHGVYRDGFRGHGNFRFPTQNNPNQCLEFYYHGGRILCGVWNANAQNFLNTPYTSQVVDDNAAIGHFVNRDSMEVLHEAIVGDGIARENLDQIFNAAITSASPVVDTYNVRGLCHLFQTCGKAFQKMADEQPGQINRSLIFRVAVLNSLNRWIGWNGAAYPAGWPLSERANADLLCGLTARIWDVPVARKTLMQDQIPVEWLLAWFHNSPNA